MSEKLYSLELVHSLSRGNQELIKKLVRVFINQTPESVQEMKAAYNDRDFITFKNLAHKVKPTYGYFGIRHIEKDLQLIELLAEIGKSSLEIEQLIRRIEDFTTHVVEEMKTDFMLN